MQDDQARWDQRFLQKPLQKPVTPDFIVEYFGQPSGGSQQPFVRLLDLASGDGAAALYLAAHGFSVNAVDISPVALARLAAFAEQQAVSIKTHTVDLDESNKLLALFGRESFDCVVMTHYKPSVQLLAVIGELLTATGKFLFSTFNERHHRYNGFSKRFCLAPLEFLDAVSGLRCVSVRSVVRDGRYMDDYCFVRR